MEIIVNRILEHKLTVMQTRLEVAKQLDYIKKWEEEQKREKELKEIEAIIREYIEELGELWFQECITVLRDHLKRIRGDNDEHLKDD